MTGYNRIVMVGNLTRDPELHTTPGGPVVADLGLAINEHYRNKAGENKESTCFVDVVAWGRQAESCAQFLSKGSPALIEGRLQFDKWQTQDGKPRQKLRIKADRVLFIGEAHHGAASEHHAHDDTSDHRTSHTPSR
jgi:single-strand DNA-binding protein